MKNVLAAVVLAVGMLQAAPLAGGGERNSTIQEQIASQRPGGGHHGSQPSSGSLDSLYAIAISATPRPSWYRASVARDSLFDRGLSTLLEQQPPRQQQTVVLALIGTIAALAATCAGLLGLFWIVPAARARLHVMRGNYDAAARIFERLIARQPFNLALYTELADIYLMTNRRDRAAIAIFRRIHVLNLPTAQREQINEILAMHYIETLEEALEDADKGGAD